MKNKRIFRLLALVVLVTGVILLIPRGPREPKYQGRTLTDWLKQSGDATTQAESAQANEALAAIGTNALPFLIHEFTRLVQTPRLQPPPLKIRFHDPGERLTVVVLGLTFLGTNAAPAAPVLIRYLHEHVRGDMASVILLQTGPAVLPHLTAAVNAADPRAASNAAVFLQLFASRPGPGRDALGVALRHADPGVRVAAVKSWSTALVAQPEVVPGLVNMTKDPSPLVAREASNQLARFSESIYGPIRNGASNALLTLRTNAPAPRTP